MEDVPKSVKAAVWITMFFLILAILVGWTLIWQNTNTNQERAAFTISRQAQVESCERNNLLRAELNLLIDIVHKDIDISADNWQAEADAGTGGTIIDLQAAARYRELLNRVEHLDIPACEEVIPHYEEFIAGESGDTQQEAAG